MEFTSCTVAASLLLGFKAVTGRVKTPQSSVIVYYHTGLAYQGKKIWYLLYKDD